MSHRPCPLRACLPLIALVLGGLTACTNRSVGAGYDAAGLPDGAPPPDAAVDPDAALSCDNQQLHMGFVYAIHVDPAQPEPYPGIEEIAGTAIYLGPVTVPLTNDMAFDREVQIEHDDGQVSTVQYYLPAGVSLPLEEGFPYTFWFRAIAGINGSALGVVITRPTSGLVPLVFVSDTGTYQAFFPEDPVIAPLKVYIDPRPECPATIDPQCGGNLLQNQLRFDFSTGGATVDVQVIQGATGEFPLFGDTFLVMNLASTLADPPCPHSTGMNLSYLVVNTTALPQTCDPARFYLWDQPYGIEVGTFCDSLFACVDSPDQAAEIEAVSPDVTCGPPEPDCSPGQQACVWDSTWPVDQGLYDQLCEVSVLADPPDRISCIVYFE